MNRPWGQWEVLKEEPTRKLKLLKVKPHSSLSMQRHQYRSESWYVVEGEGYIILHGVKFRLQKGDSIDIDVMEWHKLVNDTDNDLIIFEVQEGERCVEEDIERKEESGNE